MYTLTVYVLAIATSGILFPKNAGAVPFLSVAGIPSNVATDPSSDGTDDSPSSAGTVHFSAGADIPRNAAGFPLSGGADINIVADKRSGMSIFGIL